MYTKSFSLLVILLLVMQIAVSQHTNILISSDNNPEETSIAIDPNNTNRIAAGANIENYYFSDDAGATWSVKMLSSASFGVMGDPSLIFDNSGDVLFFHLSNPPSGVGYWIDRIVCQTSSDDGVTWNDGASIGYNPPKHQDKQWIDIDRSTNMTYVTWTEFDDYGSSSSSDSSRILFSKSSDGGLSFSDPLKINRVSGDCVDDDQTTEGAVPAVGPNGEIYVAWAGPAGIVFDRSLDQGESWLENDIFIDEQPDGWAYNVPGISRCNGLPITCCDRSDGPYQGTIYVNWSDQRNGVDDTDIWLKKSVDGGETWSDLKRVNDDPPGKQQFFTWMSVDQVTGYLWFVFYDRRDYQDSQTDVYMACSKDGGETFMNFKVSETPFLPSSGVFFGDYTGVSAHNDIVRPIWTRLDYSDLSVWTALVDVNSVGVDTRNQPIAAVSVFPNPFKTSTTFAFKIAQPTSVTLQVRDIFGGVVATIYKDRMLSTKKHFIDFQPDAYNLSSGVYFFELIGDGKLERKKMVYLK